MKRNPETIPMFTNRTHRYFFVYFAYLHICTAISEGTEFESRKNLKLNKNKRMI